MTTSIANKLVAGLLLLIWGFAWLYFNKSTRRKDLEELDGIRSLYKQAPIRMGILDSLSALLGASVGPRVVSIFFAPLFPWILIAIGSVAVADAIYLLIMS